MRETPTSEKYQGDGRPLELEQNKMKEDAFGK